MKKWNMIIDVEKCINCNNCFMSCKDEFVDNDWPGYALSQPRHEHRWLNILRKERGQCPMIDVAYLTTNCNHCDKAPCIEKATNGAVYKREDGIVIIDPEKAKGQKHLVDACPYGAIFWNEQKNVPQKCIFDAHLIDTGWKEPRCVQSCPTGARAVLKVEDSEMVKIIQDESLETLHPEYNTKPRVYYKNLYRYKKCFIGGDIAAEMNGVTDCVEGAQVTLIKDSEKIAETSTDNYGQFKIDNLEENSGSYTLEIAKTGSEKQSLQVELTESLYMGTIFL